MQLQPATQSIESVITTHTVFDEVTHVFFFLLFLKRGFYDHEISMCQLFLYQIMGLLFVCFLASYQN